MALLSANANPAGIAGLVLLATPSRPMGELLRHQLSQRLSNAKLYQQADEAIASLERGRRFSVEHMDERLRPLFHPAVQGFLMSVFRLDPLALAAHFDGPQIVIQGTRDLQVTVDDAKRLASAASNARLVIVESANHVMKEINVPDVAVNVAAYADPSIPIMQKCLCAVSDFILEHTNRASL